MENQNPATQQVNTQSTKSNKKGFVYFIFSLFTVLVVILASISAYLYVELGRSNQRIKDLENEIKVLKEDPGIPVEEGNKIFKNEEFIKFQFEYPEAVAKPTVLEITSVSDSVDVNVLGEKEDSSDKLVGLRLRVIDTQKQTQFTDTELTSNKITEEIGKYYSDSQCGFFDSKDFEKKTLPSGREYYYASKPENVCNMAGGSFEYPYSAYSIKLSDRYYAVIITSDINDRTLPDLVATTLKLN